MAENKKYLERQEFERLKREYIRDNNLNSDNIYSFLNQEQITIIQNYYEFYTKYLFKSLVGTLRLNVSPTKVSKLIEMKGQGTWEFAGMRDAFYRGAAVCELKHPIRYVYYARNIDNGQVLQFGSRCAGDFFDIDDKILKALVQLRNEMFSELKEIVAIKNLNLLENHYWLDCGIFGATILALGKEHIDDLLKYDETFSVFLQFYKVGLPFPKSLLTFFFTKELWNKLQVVMNNLSIFGINPDDLDKLKKSSLPLVSMMFTNSEKDVVSLISIANLNEKSDFFNFRNLNDLEIAMNVWRNREDRLIKAHDYFENQGVKSWKDLYDYIVKNNLFRDNEKFNNALILMLYFNKNAEISESYFLPREYKYKYMSVTLNSDIQENFDEIIDYMASRDFIMTLKSVLDKINEAERALEKLQNQINEMMSYLKEQLPMEKYDSVRGIEGVRDIILRKNLEYDSMTDRQENFVESVYNSMKRMDECEEKKFVSKVETDVNNRYPLSEKTDVLAMIQRLQDEAVMEILMVEQKKTVDIMNTVMSTHFVSDKQLKYIETAYRRYVLKEDVPQDENVPLESGKSENRKWNLVERPDVIEKIQAIKESPRYNSLYETTKNILENVLRYKVVSNKQIENIEKTYVFCNRR